MSKKDELFNGKRNDWEERFEAILVETGQETTAEGAALDCPGAFEIAVAFAEYLGRLSALRKMNTYKVRPGPQKGKG